MSNKQEKPPLKCLLGIDPEKAQKCKPSECASSGWEAAEAARRRECVKEHGLTLCADGFRRLIIRKEKDMATPYKECPLCGAHLDSGEKCECRAEEIETVHSQKCACGLLAGLRNRTLKAAGNARLIIRTKPSNVAKIALLQKKPIEREGKDNDN